MKLLLISINLKNVKEFKNIPVDISTLGIRYLSSYLKKAGHQVNTLFLCQPDGTLENKDELNQINDHVDKFKPDLIGVGLMSNHLDRAIAVTKSIKTRNDSPPIIWGGIHPTIDPKGCLEFADFVCVGEGELAVEKLLNNLNNFKEVAGIWYKENDKAVAGQSGQLVIDIDSLPYPDYDLNTQYIIHQEKLIPLSVDILRQYFPAARGDHRVMSSRGCPHSCTYCCSSIFKDLYHGHYLRMRSVDNFIGEMVEIKNKFPFVKFFKIMDDSLVTNNVKWLEEFNQQYKQKVNLPFFCNVSPLTITERKMDLLVDAGLSHTQIGLQSGSDRINKEVYSRYMKVKDFLQATKLLEKYRGRLNFSVDIIVDNPYENDEDLIKGINVLTQIKKPFYLNVFSLTIYPGTGLHKMAINDNLDSDAIYATNKRLQKHYKSLRHSTLNMIIYLTTRLTKQEIDKMINNRHRLSTRLYVAMLYFIHTKKNRLPPAILRFAAKLK